MIFRYPSSSSLPTSPRISAFFSFLASGNPSLFKNPLLRAFLRCLLVWTLLFFSFCLSQMLSSNWLLSLENILSPADPTDLSSSPAINWSRLVQLLFLAPLLEELLFRRIVLDALLSFPSPADHLPDNDSQALGATLKVRCWMTGIFFGLFHLPNMFGGSAPLIYVLLQILLAILVGTMFAMHALLARHILHVCSMHVFNNLTALFVPLSLDLATAGPVFWIFFCLNILFVIHFLSSYQKLIDSFVNQFVSQQKEKVELTNNVE